MAKRVLGSEKELAAKIIGYLKHDDWEVYQEVPFKGDAADIVVTKNNLVGVIETKRGLDLSVLEQCHRWLPHANFVWAGVWSAKRGGSRYAKMVAKTYGYGILEASPNVYDHIQSAEVHERLQPEFRRKVSCELQKVLRPEMMSGQYGEAGTNRGGRYTPFKETCNALSEVVRATPGISLKAAIEAIKRHHYCSNAAARVNLKKYIENGVIKDLKFKSESGKLLLYATIP